MTLNVHKMTNSKKTMLKIGLVALTCFTLSACGGKRAPVDAANAENTPDITRPPKVAKNEVPVEVEKNPDETVSYDEWKRQREAQLKSNKGGQ